MSYRPQCSYWLTVVIPRDMADMPGLASTVVRQVREATCDGIHVVDLADMPLSFDMHVAEDVGTVEQIPDIEAVMCRISDEHRRLTFKLSCLNEEDKSEQHAWQFQAGKVVYHKQARLIDADDEELQGLAALSLTRDRAVYLLRRLFDYLKRESDDPVRDTSALMANLMKEACKADDDKDTGYSAEDAL